MQYTKLRLDRPQLEKAEQDEIRRSAAEEEVVKNLKMFSTMGQIIFCDDLSFEDGEGGYKALKSILDGSVAASTPNVLIYATSNRRHLLPEHMKDNLTYTHTEDGEVHPGEVIEEKISLSERFGLWISFYPP